jgi:predicted O-methyltransferase YrrM
MIRMFVMVFRYIKFRFSAKNRFSLHSPFVYNLYNNVFVDKNDAQNHDFEKIHLLCRQLFSDNTPMRTDDIGEKSKAGKSHTIGKKARTISQPGKGGRVLYRLVKEFHPLSIIELGTGAGVGTLYLASVYKEIPVFTIEGNSIIFDIANKLISQSRLNNIKQYKGLFREVLPSVLQARKQVDMVFIDGDHKKDSVLEYFGMLKPFLNADSIVVLHDIYWSKDMLSAWNELVRDTTVVVSVDVFHFGILFFNPAISKQHHRIRI